MNTRLILLRHGETEANVAQIWQGSLDAPFSATGQAQVDATARHFPKLAQTFPVDHIYVSPVGRAQRTAAPIAQALVKPAIVYDPLREFDLGDWEGRSFQDLRETEDLWNRWERDPSFAPPNGESPAGFARRAVQALNGLADAHPGQTVLAVTHGGIIAYALAAFLDGESGGMDWDRWEPHNCAISVLERNGQEWQGHPGQRFQPLGRGVGLRGRLEIGRLGDFCADTKISNLSIANRQCPIVPACHVAHLPLSKGAHPCPKRIAHRG